MSYEASHTADVATRRRELFGDCALIEIIHLHDCLRGALRSLESDVAELTKGGSQLQELERRVAGRFKVIWSVFRAHSSAEDEFIWPALQSKTKGEIRGSPVPQQQAGAVTEDVTIEQGEYEEDHADEERMFSEMDRLLTELRELLVATQGNIPDTSDVFQKVESLAKQVSESTELLSQHLMAHLDKEERECMPLVKKHLSRSEIHDLVGQIMGKRSADTIAQIMDMAVQSLDTADREEMVKYMKQSMAGTFFDRWLLMSGWGSKEESEPATDVDESDERKRQAESSNPEVSNETSKRAKSSTEAAASFVPIPEVPADDDTSNESTGGVTSQAELEKLIRAIASNQALSAEQKSTTIQGLRDSVWKSNKREKEKQMASEEATLVNSVVSHVPSFPPQRRPSDGPGPYGSTTPQTAATRRVTPPTAYYKRVRGGKVELVWNSESPSARLPDSSIPLFSASELAPTYHDGAAGTVLGCPHYSRACKLRHPKSGKLYTCRLCCAQQRELPMGEHDEPLDRYAVSEVMCMRCNTLQPAEDRCMSPECASRGKPFAKYFCRICHLYDDGSRPIFHCPYCNTCRLGKGLGIDFRHCAKCNACVSLADDSHHCIPQKLQGSCPICRDSLFQSTEPLRGLKCGHVMHLKCFTEYRRDYSYTCPLCMRSMEDMKEYFALLDSAVRMQPMPAAYLSTMSNIYCQDCEKTSQVQYHFVGQKCPCGSYNTRELGRFQRSPRSSPTPT